MNNTQSTQANTQLVTPLGPDCSYSLFGKDGIMEQNQRVHLAKGTFLHAIGYAGNTQYFVIYDDKMNAVEICDGDPDDVNENNLKRYFGPIHHVDATVKPIEKVFGIGFYYDISKVISDEVIEKSLKRSENLKRLEQEKKEREAKEAEETRKRLAVEYAYLEVNEKDDHNIVGKNIRTELKRNFPGVKFSVRFDSFSGGDEFSICWEDGPTKEQVDLVVSKYQNHHSDFTGDYWDYDPSEFNNLFGGVSYVSTDRTITEKAIEAMRKKYPDLTEENKTTYHFEEERAGIYARENASHSVESILRVAACYVDFTPKKKESGAESKPKPSAPQDTPNSFQVIDYNERCIVVIGDTKPLSGQLKKLGVFNSRLSCGPGWAFSKKNKEHLKEADKLLRGAIASQFPELMKGGE